MSEAKSYIKMMEDSGSVEKGRTQKLAAAALRLEIGQQAIHPLEAVKELVGIKKPIHERALRYIVEGIEQAKPRAGMAAMGIGAVLATAGLVKAYNRIKFETAMADLKKDPAIQADPKRAISIAKMVQRWAPSIAADKEILKGTVKNLMKFPDDYLTFDIAKKLSEAEAQYAATHGLIGLLQKRII